MSTKKPDKRESTKSLKTADHNPPKKTVDAAQLDDDDVNNNKDDSSPSHPSMTVALFVCWVLPVLFLAIVSRYAVDTTVPTIDIDNKKPNKSRPIAIQLDKEKKKKSKQRSRHDPHSSSPSPQPADRLSHLPTAYQDLVITINKRRRKIKQQQNPSTKKKGVDKQSKPKRTMSNRGASTDPERIALRQKLDQLRQDYESSSNPNDLFRALAFADALRLYDLQYHDGGTYQNETIDMYNKIVDMAVERRRQLMDAGEPTDKTVSDGMTTTTSINDELTLDYTAKSADGLLCAIYSAQGKAYYMANMFERALESYSNCLDNIYPYYLDALNSRGTTLIILGRYQDAARDFMEVIKRDQRRLFNDAFTGLARVLGTKEDAIPEGWDGMVGTLELLIPRFEAQLEANPQVKQYAAGALNRFHHCMFVYHDAKTKDYPEAWRHLTESYKHKMSLLPPWPKGFETQKVAQAMQIFTRGFWPPNIGSPTTVPIFIVGFVRSGSTLLERVLDAHPMIVGTGENSVFNGRLDDIRNKIVEVSSSGQGDLLGGVTRKLADEVVDEMKRRWEVLEANTEASPHEEKEDPKRFVDKMLTNYYNIGFIHMLYPNALILHVAREPMDTLFSAYKHEFPSGTLDYTSDFPSLAELYLSYRDLMDHWDKVLPGRITHIRYEDMVNDMPGVARSIIEATGLPWDESVLDFHKKKHAVNTLSTTQVRKGVYKDSIKSWMRYEEELQPLVELVGERLRFDLKTTLPGYQVPSQDSE